MEKLEFDREALTRVDAPDPPLTPLEVEPYRENWEAFEQWAEDIHHVRY